MDQSSHESISGREVVDVIEGGIDLYTSDGERIGHVDELHSRYFILGSSDLLGGEAWIPRTGNERQEGNDVYLDYDRSWIEGQNFTQRPGDLDDTSGDYSGRAMGGLDTDRDLETERGSFSSQQTTTDYGSAAGMNTAEYGREGVSSGTVSDQDTMRVQRHEEELQAQKVARPAGEVEINKNVVEEQRTLEVPVTREEVHVRRVEPTGQTTGDSTAFDSGDTIRVPITEEQVQVTKTPRVVEELEIEKVRTQDTQQVSDTVRREEFDIDQQGQVHREDGTTR
jgi:uncharacterized protein (TIGR02271 family)